MITNRLVIVLILSGAVLFTTTLACLLFGPCLTRLWRRATPFGRFSFAFAALAATLFAGTKTNQTDEVEGQRPTSLLSTSSTSAAQPSVTSNDIAYGWQPLRPRINLSVNYTMPGNAMLTTNWWIRGAYEDLTPVSNLWAFSWGKVRFALDATNEIVAVGAPMSAVPFRSRLWSATDSNGTFRITWEDFLLGRDTNTSVSAQIELRRNGDYVTRSNEFETVWRRIDPDDWDGDGYLNSDDWNPYDWDDGADWYYGPRNDLPSDGNANAYCTITIEVDGPGSHWVSFVGDNPSDYTDPSFLAKPGVPYDVKILIGKTYVVETDTGIRVIGRSSNDITIFNAIRTGFSVVWPVTIQQEAVPPPSTHGGFSLSISPSWLCGVVSWQNDSCCQITNHNDNYEFICQDNCRCNGCSIEGYYAYEGYTLMFDDIRCNCHYRPHITTTFNVQPPPVLFKNGEIRPLYVNFIHGDTDRLEEGMLTLTITSGGEKVRLWDDESKSSSTTTPSWDVNGFYGCILYVEGIETSAEANDIAFALVWERPDGSTEGKSAATTCVEVLRTEVSTTDPDILDGSPNRQPFAAHTNWTFDVTHSPYPDKHYSVLFHDVVNADFSVRNFSIDMRLVVHPLNVPIGTARWFALAPTPGSGEIVGTGPCAGALRNPKVGGVYRIASCFDGSPTNECTIVLPLAGAEMSEILRDDLVAADGFVNRSKSSFPRRWYTRALFASKWFTWDKYGYYRGRPDNAKRQTVYYYNQVNDDNGKGAIGTLLGVPIHVEKLSNLLAGYACEKLEVPIEEQGLSQWYGTGNDESAELSWTIGTRLAAGSNFSSEIGYLTTNAYRYASEKCRRLWPNTAPTDNHRDFFGHDNFNTEFSSPGFIYSNR